MKNNEDLESRFWHKAPVQDRATRLGNSAGSTFMDTELERFKFFDKFSFNLITIYSSINNVVSPEGLAVLCFVCLVIQP